MMKRNQSFRLILSWVIVTTFFTSGISQQNLTGTFVMTADQTTLTLTMSQSANQLTGSLSSTTGVTFQLLGEAMEGSGAGVCKGDGSSLFFEVFAQGNELTLGLIEPDEFNMPDYNRAQYLLFTRQSGQGSPPPQQSSATQKLFGNQQQSASQEWNQQPNNQPQQERSEQTVSPAQQGNTALSGNEVGDPSWGFILVPPAGWVSQKTAEGAILGHNTIAGMILVLPHRAGNMQQMQQELAEGLQEEGNYLSLSGTLRQQGQNMLSGDYSGMMDGTTVRAKGMGVLSPYGGGAYLIAVSTPDKLGADLVAAAESVARSMRFVKQETSDLMSHFTGNWSTFTTNTTTWISFGPNGIYSDKYESVYSGNTTDGYGNVTGNWGTAGQDSNQGRWIVRGTKESGQIIVTMNNGREKIFNYKVQQENGRTYYGEYWINGSLYSKE